MTPDDDAMTDADALAMDYALGALDRDATQAASLRLRRDPAFRREVETWQSLLTPLNEAILPVAPPPSVWTLIVDEIAPPQARAAPARRAGLGLWRGWAIGATAAAVVAVAALVVRPGTSDQPLLVATLSSKSGGAMLTATYDAARGAVILTPADRSDAAGRTPELWVIEGSNPPRSLGTIDISNAATHAIPHDRLKGLKAGSTLAISLEPKGGSPTGTPTGPVVATGTLTGI